jgi:hypothetical protein
LVEAEKAAETVEAALFLRPCRSAISSSSYKYPNCASGLWGRSDVGEKLRRKGKRRNRENWRKDSLPAGGDGCLLRGR